MEISTVEYKRCDVVKVTGRIDSASAPQLHEEFNKLMEANHFHIVFNMVDVSFISSAGLRVLISTQKNCKRFNRGELVLANVPENIRAALDLAGFTALFKIFDSEVAAVGNF
ncbi:MAG: STAS domain-containing protein [Anaerolineaceae bacterium]|jgi:anti-sigma B factor antagonist|nr:STAS domain-containing protein [Anaerolineaceae bacterium]